MADGVHLCETCDVPNAPFGFAVLYVDDGRERSVQLWFCSAHRADGEHLWRTSREHRAPGATLPPSTAPEPAPEPVTAQGSLDL